MVLDVWLTITAPREVARLFRAALCSERRALERETGRLPAEGEAFETMLDHALRAWGVDDPWLARRMRRLSPVFGLSERPVTTGARPGSGRAGLHFGPCPTMVSPTSIRWAGPAWST